MENIKQQLIGRFGRRCWGCDVEDPETKALQVDHIIPKSDGGPDTINNLCLLCGPCNRQKGSNLTLSGLRAEIKSGRGERDGRKPSDVELVSAMDWTRDQYEKSLRNMTIQRPLLEVKTMEIEPKMASSQQEAPDSSQPPHFEGPLEIGDVIGLLWHQDHKELASALNHAAVAIEIDPSYGNYPSGFTVYFRRGATKELLDAKRAITTAKDVECALIEAICLSLDYHANYELSVKVSFIPTSHPLHTTNQYDYGNDDVDDLPF